MCKHTHKRLNEREMEVNLLHVVHVSNFAIANACSHILAGQPPLTHPGEPVQRNLYARIHSNILIFILSVLSTSK